MTIIGSNEESIGIIIIVWLLREVLLIVNDHY